MDPEMVEPLAAAIKKLLASVEGGGGAEKL